MNSITTTITYDFFYNADGAPWFCSYATVIMLNGEIVHSELIQSSSECDFERLHDRALEENFEKGYEYINPETHVHGETYRKVFEGN